MNKSSAVVCERVEIDDKIKEPEAKNDDETKNMPENSRRKGLLCCCHSSSNFNDNEDTDDALHANEYAKTEKFSGCLSEMKSFMSSPIYYIFIITITLSIFIVLLVELFIDTGLLYGSSNEDSDAKAEAEKVSVALHWFSFAILTGFFLEIILRLISWRMAFMRDCVAVFDSFIVFAAFISNLCATLIAGPISPFDSICLIIILRLIRIHSLIKAKIDLSTRELKSRIKKTDEELMSGRCTVNALHRRIEEKDYEIRQLQAHLGSEVPFDYQRMRLRDTKGDHLTQRGASADTDLEMAIALSKSAYEEENLGIVNKAFSHNHVQEEKDFAVLIHPRPERSNSGDLEEEGLDRGRSLMKDHFFVPDAFEQSPLVQRHTGAIPKRKAMTLPIQSNVNNNNNIQAVDFDEKSLQVLKIEDDHKEPITVCIDPSILECDSPVSNHFDLQIWTKEEQSKQVALNTSSPPSDVGSSDDSMPAKSLDGKKENSVKPQKDFLKTWPKTSGSLISSESGYLSEDLNMKKKLAAMAASRNSSNEIVTSSV